ncbi:hypothetical protein GCM10022415_31850 [Knoellia locipacati]|uniref:Uncharacterized protein n=1 Tax=Knoellia locipacati TaxID=882824 RepID=A0A512T3Z1_9MICO|nr:nucleotidyltransferase family protein [Knoellia locipacati]GEQ14811.1 hypothetical protein KLO01_28580 [Knoellia locipacati]
MAELPALVVAAGWGLPTTTGSAVVDDSDRDRLLHGAGRDRLGGLLAAAVGDGSVVVSADLAAEVTATWHEQLAASVTVECLVPPVADLLHGAGVDWRLTKGPALAHLDYPDPSLRPFGDVDVLVRPGQWQVALDALAEGGWVRVSPELAPGFDERFGKGATLTNAVGLEVDAHRRLAAGRFGLRLDSEQLFEDVEWLELGGRQVPCLAARDRLLHACFHASLGGARRLRAFRDVAQLLLMTEADWEGAVTAAERASVQAVVASAVVETWRRLGLATEHPALDWARGVRVGAVDRRALRLFEEERSYAQQALTAVPDLLGRGAGRYLWALAVKPGHRAAAPAPPRTATHP